MAAWTGTSNIWRGMRVRSSAHELATRRLRPVAVDDDAERVDRLAVHEHVELHEPALAVADLLVVHRGVALGATLELVVEVDDDLGQRQLEGHEHARRVEVLHVEEGAAPVRAQLEERADVARPA